MRKAVYVATLTVAAGMAMPVMAQDSTAIGGAGASDAVSPFTVSEQFNDYVVDLFPFMTSGGTTFGIAPLVKSSQYGTMFTNALMSAQGMSRNIIRGADTQYFNSPTFGLWNVAGAGVNNNPAKNNPPGSLIMPANIRNMFSATFSEFGTAALGGSSTAINTAVIQYSPADPSRLYVKRIVSATNDLTGANNQSQFGVGSVDANGNVQFRADGFGTAGGFPITGNNLLRVLSLQRDPNKINVISRSSGVTGGDDAAATRVPVNESMDTINPPSLIPQAINGSRTVMTSSNFNSEYINESAPGVMTADLLHLDIWPDHRGATQFTPLQFPAFGATAGTMAMLGRGVNVTESMLVWGVDKDGNHVAGTSIIRPAPSVAKDNEPMDIHTYPYQMEFTNYQSQTAFRGGNGQVALGRDGQGRMLLAAAYSFSDVADPTVGTLSNEPEGGIVVARFDPANPAAVEYGLAAWNEFNSFLGLPNEGKGIYDAANVRIGELALFDEVSGGTPLGPSFSSPMIDAAGNVWFLGAAQLYRDLDDDLMDPLDTTPDDFDVVLLRGVYDAATFSWKLELVLEPGNIFTGVNSGTDYMVTFISLDDSNSIDSAAPYSGHLAGYGHNGAPYNNYPAADPRNLGGMILNAEIVYDVDGNGMFDEWDSVNNPTGVDQGYQVLLYIGALDAGCVADFDFDGTVGGADLAFLLASWGAAFGPADLNADGNVDGADLAALLASWGPCP